MLYPFAPSPHQSHFAPTAVSTSSSKLPTTLDNIRIINVKSNIARWKAIEAQLKAAGIIQYERVDAVDGSAMDAKTLRSLVTTEAYVRILGQQPRTSHADISTVGQVACALSHKTIWHDLVYGHRGNLLDSKEYVTILEDDAIIPPDTPHRIQQALKTLPSDADIIFYGFIGTPTLSSSMQPNNARWARVSKIYGCQSYCMTKRAAKFLLDQMGVLDCQLDTSLCKIAQKLNLKMYVCLPPLIQQGNFASTIQVKGDCQFCGPLQ